MWIKFDYIQLFTCIRKRWKYRSNCSTTWQSTIVFLFTSVDMKYCGCLLSTRTIIKRAYSKFSVINFIEIIVVYARSWAKAESADINSLSERMKGIRSLVNRRIWHLRNIMPTKYVSIFKDHDGHDKFVFVQADKASNNIVFVCKKYYLQCTIHDLGLSSQSDNPTYSSTPFSESDVLDNHTSVLWYFGNNDDNDSLELPYIYIGSQKYILKTHIQIYAGSFLFCSQQFWPQSKLILSNNVAQHILETVWIRCGYYKFRTISSHQQPSIWLK